MNKETLFKVCYGFINNQMKKGNKWQQVCGLSTCVAPEHISHQSTWLFYWYFFSELRKGKEEKRVFISPSL